MRNALTATNITPVIVGTIQVVVCRYMMIQLADISMQAVHLAGVDTARFCSHAINADPNRGCA